ncbi:LLM class flavin-dependent oxidoreductase [Aerococcus sp. 1KP-2016]|uniref:LLM class flavin-dependent oxidoreductase n=1 Tax=Aerococcus sp. 1KP-2016 TaxID=1981982 RepID=UPI000B98FECE|nr:LLM class flavin-dependent oxidoreductase [Aerococcus sp. 1KP-2016]OYQ65725.1 LLM class flavin-dependent oxidoreductase [Aerococcus sp. 1KP-2016]
MTKKQLKLGVLLFGAGAHMNSWKAEDVAPDASIDFDHYVNLTKKAEANGVDFVFVADGLYIDEKSIPHFVNRFEPLTLLSALAPITSKIGLVGTLSTTYSEPYNVARQFASLDIISKGRAGWNVVTSPLQGSAGNYNKGNHPEHDLRYDMADEYLEVTKGLWDSFDDDAFTRDRETGEFYDKNKVHVLNHKGTFFNSRGPLNIQRTPQGQPVIFQAGASPRGIEFAAKHGEVIFNAAGTLEKAQEYYKAVKDQVAANSRNPEEVVVLPQLQPITGATAEEVEANYQKLQNLISLDEALDYLARFFDHHDFKQYDPDAEFPELGEVGSDGFRSTSDAIKARAKEENLTLREVALQTATPKGSFYGTYDELVEKIITWLDNDAADGFMLTELVYGEDYDNFFDNVLAKIAERGYYSYDYEGKTLRDHLGLSYKESQYKK